jgi:hypothetical protein
LILPAATARAQWGVELGRSGFWGKVSLGPTYRFSPAHSVGASLGTYNNGPDQYAQFNGIYRYSAWNFETPKLYWQPLTVGAFAICSLDSKRFFVKSPDKYPADYYEQTQLRGGIEFGTNVMLKSARVSFAIYLRVLENGMVALFNNAHRDLQYYSASGFALHYQF